MRKLVIILNFFPLYFFCARLLSLPINLYHGDSLGYFGDPPILPMLFAFPVTPVIMGLLDKKFNFQQAETAFLFTVACYALTMITFLLLNSL